MLIVLGVLLLFIFYTYFGYYLYLVLRVKWLGTRPIQVDPAFEPEISILISARNEQANIRKRLLNLLDTGYPRDKIQIIVVSDGSTDATVDEVLRIKAETGADIHCIDRPQGGGKPSALNAAVKQARADVLVFADARQTFEQGALQELVKNFADARVGCVSGQLVFEEASSSSIKKEVNAYWDFEKKIRMLESDTGSVVGATGAIYALRKSLYRELPAATLLDDVLTPMNAAMQGYRVIFEKNAIAYDVVARDFEKEKNRKIRTLAGNWQLLLLKPALLNPIANPLFFRFMSHKIFRVMVPYVLIAMVLLVLLLGDAWLVQLMLSGALLLALLLLFEKHLPLKGLGKILKLARAFLYLNYFALLAPVKLFFSRNLWQK